MVDRKYVDLSSVGGGGLICRAQTKESFYFWNSWFLWFGWVLPVGKTLSENAFSPRLFLHLVVFTIDNKKISQVPFQLFHEWNEAKYISLCTKPYLYVSKEHMCQRTRNPHNLPRWWWRRKLEVVRDAVNTSYKKHLYLH